MFNQKTIEFIKKAKKLHGELYDYSNVHFISSKKNVEIKCKIHGSFHQSPANHLRSKVCCSKCRGHVINTKDFIKKAKKLHGDLYDYSNVHFISSKKNVEIKCKIHGSFYQTPPKHLLGRGCSKCKGFGKTTEEFIKQAIAVHGNFYNYGKTKYKNSSTNVTINCSIHGDFTQNPNVHLRGNGCTPCGIHKRTEGRKLSKEELLKRFHEKHGQRYDYSEINFKNIHTPIQILCKKHGYFSQTPQEHFSANGCTKCFPRNYDHLNKYRSGPHQAKVAKIYSPLDIKKKSNLRHKNKYTYPNLKPTKLQSKITITCSKHGNFTKRLDQHFNGYGCVKCSWEKLAESKNLSFEDFIKRATFIHKGFYNYDKVEWVAAKNKIDILCPIHGLFKQNAQSHLQGRRCNECAKKARGLKKRKDIDSIIAELTSIHKNAYSYDRSSIQTTNKYMTITCPKHGEFFQTPSHHRAGKGCPICKNDKIGNALRASPNEVISKFKNIHGNEFDYSLVEQNYVNTNTPVPIICKIHGVFWQAPYNHIGRSDKCPSCKASKGEIAVADWLKKNNLEYISE